MDNLWSSRMLGMPANDQAGDADLEIQVEGVGAEGISPELTSRGVVFRYPDGSIDIELSSADDADDEDGPSNFDDNLARFMGDSHLMTIANDLIRGIEADDQARSEWIDTRERAIDLLALTIEEPRTETTSTAAPLEGLSTVQHPVLLEAVLRALATAAAELLPASGPVKIELQGDYDDFIVELAELLEQDINFYVRVTATEYYPDTRRTLFWSSFGGSGFKKVYPCPIRQRPVSEMVDAKDLIISPGATDLQNAERVTHVTQMRQSVMKRMQVLGVYRDVHLTAPTSTPNKVDEKEAQIEGIATSTNRPEDATHTKYECYCELDLDEFAPDNFKGLAVPLPYRVTIDKDSRTVLELRRDWEEDDELALRKRVFIKYPYIEAFGIYGIGLLHILGNSNIALTGGWRVFLDNAMFSNLPCGLVDKAVTRQNSNEMRVPPGSFIQLDLGTRKMGDVFAPTPYRDIGPVAVQFIQQIEQTVQRVGGIGEVQVGEGKQDAPVGTTLALIEQQTKLETEVHKGLHTAQAEELRLLRDLLRENPSVLWRGCRKSKFAERLGIAGIGEDQEKRRHELFVLALNMCELVPMSDPNVPSHVHRMLKLQALKQLQMGNPNMDGDKIDKMIVRALGFDPKAVWRDQPAQPQQDPAALAAQQSAQAQTMMAQAKLMDSQTNAQKANVQALSSAGDMQARQKDLDSRENIAALNLVKEQVIHAQDARRADRELAMDSEHQDRDRQADLLKQQNQLRSDMVQKRADIMAKRAEAALARKAQNERSTAGS